MRIPWSDAEIPKGGSRARHRSGAGLDPNGDLCAISRVGADLGGRSDGGGHAKDVGLRSWPDKTADRADRALNPRGHRWSDDGYEPEIAFEIPILKLGPKISGGIVGALNNFSGDYDSAMMFEFGFLLKAWINPEGSNIVFRPGFGISYGALGEMGDIESSGFLVLNALGELVVMKENGLNWVISLGITGAPTGGNDDFDMSYGPGFFLRGGLEF